MASGNYYFFFLLFIGFVIFPNEVKHPILKNRLRKLHHEYEEAFPDEQIPFKVSFF
jgi:hypothetical protein